MKQEQRTIVYDEDLGVEACRFAGVKQRFPNHFHEHYVLGFIEKGRRRLTCRGHSYVMDGGDLLLLNPLDNHACEQVDGGALDFRSIHILPHMMRRITAEIPGLPPQPRFVYPVGQDEEGMLLLKQLHRQIRKGHSPLEKEETLLLLVARLVQRFADGGAEAPVPPGEAVLKAQEYLNLHYAEGVRMETLAALCGMNRYTLLRSFTRQFGITPYGYLETLRINEAKRLLEAGEAPIEAAAACGFTDQSHFTRFFKSFIGVTPSRYAAIYNGPASAQAEEAL